MTRRYPLLLLLLAWIPISAVAAEPKLSGSLETVDGVRVLRVWGKPYDRGFAHGRLLAADIVAMIGETMLHPETFPEIDAYESAVRQRLLPLMKLPRDRRHEIEGMLAGIRDALGEEKMKLPRVDRALVLDDLIALNTAADWAGLQCSSFSVWGEQVENGQMITARNLDYSPLPAMQTRQLLIAHLASPPDRRAWFTVGWPGIIGAYTAMNDAGVTVSMHDAPAGEPADFGPFTPRALVLAEIMERADENNAMTVAQEVMTAHRVMCGNNIHVSAPFHGQEVPAAVFEYDADRAREGGVTRRSAADQQPGAAACRVICTNHYRKRAAPTECERFAGLAAGLSETAEKHEKIDAPAARRIVATAARKSTLHTVVFLPNDGRFDVSFADESHHAAAGRVVSFKLADVLRNP